MCKEVRNWVSSQCGFQVMPLASKIRDLSWIERMRSIALSRLQKNIGHDATQKNELAGIHHKWETIPYFMHCAVFNSIPKRIREGIVAADGRPTRNKGI